MAGLVESIRKEWYRLSTPRRLAKQEWAGRYWHEDGGGARVIACRHCPKFDAREPRCSVPFGTPLRKCVAASSEAHLHDATGLQTLELGYGRRSLAKCIVESSGGSWTGLEPNAPRGAAAAIGSGGYGHAGHIPFADETFDLVFGIQSIEHWEERQPSLPEGLRYAGCLAEIWRVLKPDGAIYFDAPIHLHGHEMFVLGDLPRIRRLFDAALWTDVVLERWRHDHEPLPKYPTPKKDATAWRHALSADVLAHLEQCGVLGKSVWLLAITARKTATHPSPAT